MSAAIYGQDIFDTAYSYVRELLLSKRTKSSALAEKTTSEHYYETSEEAGSKTEEPITTSIEGSKDTVTRLVETTVETTESTLEEGVEATLTQELNERFPFILAAVCGDLSRLDEAYRGMRGDDPQEEFSEFFIDLGDLFPLSERFCFPCAMYVSSMFLIDSDAEASDRFFARYSDSVSEISKQIPFESSGTIERYPY